MNSAGTEPLLSDQRRLLPHPIKHELMGRSNNQGGTASNSSLYTGAIFCVFLPN